MAPTFFTNKIAFIFQSFLAVSTLCSASSFQHAHLHNSRRTQLTRRDPINSDIQGWDVKGCYTDNSNSRTLYELSTFSNDGMTAEFCVDYCSSNSYPYAGVEYGSECYCSRSIAASAQLSNANECLFPCSGDSSKACGGNSRITIYHNSSDIASAKAPSTNAGPAGWGFLGCYVDSQVQRTLPFGAATPGGGNAMTVAVCTEECQRQGYKFAGVEYGGECFCGNALSQDKIAPDGLALCDRVCNGNTTEYCGGPNRLNVYGFGKRSTIAPLWSPLGCFADIPGSRTLRYGAQVPGGYMNMTIPGCTAACQDMGYKLAGLEYSQECFCDSAFQNNESPVSDGCTMACKGDPSTICGGPNRMNVFGFDNSTDDSAPTTTRSSSSTGTSRIAETTTLISTTTSSTAIPTAYHGNWTYQGCYIDNRYGRILPQQVAGLADADVTIESCIKKCVDLGFTVAGMQYSTQCFCGKDLINGAEKASLDTECNMPCGGDSSQICGAGDRNSVWSPNNNITIYPVPSPKNSSLPDRWEYKGCLSEAPNFGRLFRLQIDDATNNTVDGCLKQCGKFGFSAAGLEYGEQCFCGDDWDRTNTGVPYLAESVCSMSCPGDAYHLCGGPGALSYYTTPDIPDWHQGEGDSAGSYDFLIGGLVIPLITQIGVNGKVVLTEKHGTGPPNSTGAYELDVSQADNGMDAAWREMYGLRTDVFCSAGMTLPDKAGRIFNVGGWSGDSTFGVRFYSPDGSDGVKGLNDWEENYEEISLQAGRWYPTALQLVNGSIFVIGGQIGSNGPPVPNGEILPKPEGGHLVHFQWLQDTDPYNLYPFLTVLPSGNIAVFYYNEARILDPNSFDTIRQLPDIPGSAVNPKAGRTYPLEGTSMLLPQHAPYTDPLKVLICGGSTPFTGLALDNCVNIAPDEPNAEWEIERMPDRRVITCMTALPDGTYLILNGARQGEAGFGLGTDPAHMAMLYEPEKPYNSRFTRMANTTIDRLYHSEAILLMDGRILVSGSDPEDGIHPQEYRMETFTPPYLMGGLAASRPTFEIDDDPTEWGYGGSLSITITNGASVSKISLMAAVASTHGNSMGQRTIFPSYSCSGSKCIIQAPPDGKITGGPGWHMLFVLNENNTPSMAQWVRIGGDPAGLGNWPQLDGFTLPGI